MLFRITLIFLIFISSLPLRANSASQYANTANMAFDFKNGKVLNNSFIVAENNFDDEWDDEDWDEDDWDDEDWDDDDWDDDNWDDEDIGEPAPVSQRPVVSPRPVVNQASSQAPSQTQQTTGIMANSQPKKTQATNTNTQPPKLDPPVFEAIEEEDNNSPDEIIDIKKFQELTKIKGRTINNLVASYSNELVGLNPENPKDLREIRKLLEIVGEPPKRPAQKAKKGKLIYKDDPIINFSARNITVRDAFATLARISGKSITVSGSIQDRDVVSVVEINDQPYTKAFFSLVQAAGVDFTVSGDSYTILRRTGAAGAKLFSLEATEVDTSLPMLERVADLSYDNQDLTSVLKDLTNKYGIDIIMTANPTERVTARVRNVNIAEALQLLLAGSASDFTRSGDAFVIYNKTNKNFSLDRKVVLFPLKHLDSKNISKALPTSLKDIVKVSEEQNALIAEGSKEELLQVYNFLRVIDQPIKQVGLDIKLVEISKDLTSTRSLIADTVRFGEVGRPVITSTAGAAGAAATTMIDPIARGISPINFNSDNLFLLQRNPSFSRQNTFAQIKVNQNLVVASGKSANINFDQDVNFVLGQGAGAGGGAGVVQSQTLSRITAGTSMKITPIVGENGIVTVEVEVEVSENGAVDQNTGVPATTTRRRFSSEVQVIDKQTITIGGLFQNNDSNTGAEIPLFGRIPVLGNLFGNKTNQKRATELIVLVTPKIQNPFEGEDEPLFMQADLR